MIRNCLFITITFLFFTSCKEGPNEVTELSPVANSKMVHLKLIDTLGTVVMAVPVRYDTSFVWVDYSDCGAPCQSQVYRYQPKDLPIIKESGWFWPFPTDSVERFTIKHSKYFYPRNGADTVRDLEQHQHLIDVLKSERLNVHIVFDTIEKINDRYYSIIEMERSDTVRSKEVLAMTKLHDNQIYFKYELLTKKDDSITKNFIKNSLDLIRTIRFGL